MEDKTPEDDLDAICKRHDTCYDNEDRLTCARRLVEEIAALDPDPRKWKNPPQTEDDIAYAKTYMGLAEFWFRFHVRSGEVADLYRDDPEGLLPMMP